MPEPKKKGERTPSPRVRRAVDLFVENLKAPPGKQKTQGQIMSEAGYSDEIAKKPSKVTKSDSFLRLIHEKLPERRVAEIQAEALVAASLRKEKIPIDAKATPSEIRKVIEEFKGVIESVPGARYLKYRKASDIFHGTYLLIFYLEPDTQNRVRILDQYHKIAGNYAPLKSESKNLHFSLTDLRRLHEEKRGRVVETEAYDSQEAA